ncbi:MAG: toxin-antitoxin system YwqK family antitoxin, partial [Bacteroidota bacterium]
MRSASLLLLGLAAVTVLVAARPDRVDAAALSLRATEGRVYHEGEPFTGASIRRDADGTLVERIRYVDGKRDGLTERWFENGARSERVPYTANRRHGTVQTWWPNGHLRAEARFVEGVAHGTQRQWYRSGALFKELHLVEGREDGLQRAWR